ncbi:hypothetical protein [Aquimarina sp. RZ0]|uniref:HYC_CC_PP family protein n=1 Tax=Aquimarina sp. RZ0 TaxID=2607730 RepID=UPI0011F3F206|nr:hypothetical protein [Aquimarina sp. RZ0]KAA1242395.1 hypothetical protein F0000_25765 [Aquimarina sp. RZ0]
MIKEFQKIASVVLAFLVLFSTLSFTVEKHYCGRFLVDVAVFSKAKDCGMEMTSDNHTNDILIKKSCCKDELLVLEGQDELKDSLGQKDITKQLLFAHFYNTCVNVFLISEKEDVVFKEYDPPERTIDSTVLYQVFLI